MGEGPSFLVAPPPRTYDQGGEPGVEADLPSDEEMAAASELLESFPVAMRTTSYDAFSETLRPYVCSMRQLKIMELMTGVSDVFAADSPVADWLLTTPNFVKDGRRDIEVDNISMRHAFVSRKSFWSRLRVEHGHERRHGDNVLVQARHQNVLCIPNRHIVSHSSVLGTIYHTSDEGAGEEESPRFSRFVLHLPTSTSYFLTVLKGGSVALDRCVHGTGRQVSYESIVIDHEGSVPYCLFAELRCQFCHATKLRRTKQRKAVLYAGCECSPTIQARTFGTRRIKALSGWRSFTALCRGTIDYAVGIYTTASTQSALGRPWMLASRQVITFQGTDHPLAVKLRVSMIQFMKVPISKVTGLFGDLSSSNGEVPCEGPGKENPIDISTFSFSCLSPLLTLPDVNQNPAEHSKSVQARKKCKFCDSTFAQTGNLTRHIRRMHTPRTSCVSDGNLVQQSLFDCRFCQASFTCIANLARHTRVGHKQRHL